MIGIYARVSTEKQRDNYSLPVQKKRGIEFAKSIGDEYIIYEEAKSGRSMTTRIEINRLLEDIKKGIVDKVWAIELTRLSRSVEDSEVLKRIIRQYKVRLYINGLLTTLDSADQRFTFTVNAAMAEHERENIIERVKRGLAARKNAGKMHFPHILGYDRKFDEDGKVHYVINQQEAETVRGIFKRKAEGWSLSRLTKDLNDNHIQTKFGRSWTRRAVLNALHHRIYTGKTETTEKQVIQSRLYEAIIGEEEFDYVWQHYNRGVTYRNFFAHYRFQSSGLIECPICGAKWRYYNCLKNGKKYEYYRADHLSNCTNQRKGFRKEYIDDALDRMLFVAFVKREDSRMLFEKARAERLNRNVNIVRQIEKHQDELKRLAQRKNKIVEAISNETISMEDAKNVMGEIQTRETVIGAELSRAKSETEEDIDPRLALGMFTTKELAKYIESTEADKKKLIQEVVRKITILNGEMNAIFVSGLSLKVDLGKYEDRILNVYGKATKLYRSKSLNQQQTKSPPQTVAEEGASLRKKNLIKFAFKELSS